MKPEADICPKCGSTMEGIALEVLAPDAPSRLRSCPNCDLLAWDEDGQVQTREGESFEQ